MCHRRCLRAQDSKLNDRSRRSIAGQLKSQARKVRRKNDACHHEADAPVKNAHSATPFSIGRRILGRAFEVEWFAHCRLCTRETLGTDFGEAAPGRANPWMREPCSRIEPGLLDRYGALFRRHLPVQRENGEKNRHRTCDESPQQNDFPSPSFVDASIFGIQFKSSHRLLALPCWPRLDRPVQSVVVMRFVSAVDARRLDTRSEAAR